MRRPGQTPISSTSLSGRTALEMQRERAPLNGCCICTRPFAALPATPRLRCTHSVLSLRLLVDSWLTTTRVCPPLTGATGPLLPYWDPLGMGTARPEKFQRWRAVEIKHGRIAMMATLGTQACRGCVVGAMRAIPGLPVEMAV